MPCHAAMIDRFLNVSSDADIESTLGAMKKASVEIASVVDPNGGLLGVFSLKNVLENILPVSVAVQEGIQLDVRVGAAPGIPKRLKKILPQRVGDLMDRKFAAVYPDTPIWEGASQLVQNNGAPLVVLEPKSGRALGIITTQSMLDELNRLKDSES